MLLLLIRLFIAHGWLVPTCGYIVFRSDNEQICIRRQRWGCGACHGIDGWESISPRRPTIDMVRLLYPPTGSTAYDLNNNDTKNRVLSAALPSSSFSHIGSCKNDHRSCQSESGFPFPAAAVVVVLLYLAVNCCRIIIISSSVHRLNPFL